MSRQRYPEEFKIEVRGIRLLLLTRGRTGELRAVTSEQFDLERGL